MASPQNTRRFYIDQEADHAVVRTVPVRRPAAPEAQASSPATHQVAPETTHSHHVHFPRIPSNRVGQLIRSARKRTHHHSS